jgi:hypothetical protein
MEDTTLTTNECQELKNIKYKTMLLNGVPLQETKSSNNLTNLDKFLENEKVNNVNEPWCKLNKTIKTKKLQDYVEIYKKLNNLSDEEGELLFIFLKDCIDRKKLQRVKDVLYDKENGSIKEIPALHYVKANKHFTLKNIDKRVSTLKSLAPKKSSQGTIRKKDKVKQKDSDSEEDDDN